MTRLATTAFALLAGCVAPAHAGVTLIGVATQPGDSSDLSGLKGKPSDGPPADRLGGHGSSIAYTGRGNEYVLVPDRGPSDGAVDYACRMHRMEIQVTPGATPAVALKLTATTLLTDESGKGLVGALTHLDRRFDPEGVRVGRDGTVYLSDEYGPFLAGFDATGKRVRDLPVPPKFRPAKFGKTPAEELPPNNTVGRAPNRGMEGLAISPDGEKLFGILQSPLLQDGMLQKDDRVGVNCRILEVTIKTGKTREFVYPLDNPANGVSEILAVNDHEFLVLERDGNAGKLAAFKKVVHVDVAGATDVSAVAALPAVALPAAVAPVKKKVFLDLLKPEFKIAGDACPEKFEGLAFGPDLPDGRRLLLVTVDNDFVATEPTRVYAFAIDRADLPGFAAQKFDPAR